MLIKYNSTAGNITINISLKPKTSKAKNIGVIHVFVAEENTKQYPKPATINTGSPSHIPNTTPQLAPIANNGVTSPPLKPIAVHIAVNINF